MDARPEVFVVDDDALVRRALGRIIAAGGYEVRTFGSAREFLDAWSGGSPACLVLDLRLPDLDGMELHRRLRESGSGVQVIFMTGFGDIRTSVEAMKAGAFDFLTKPVSESTLLTAIEAALAEASRAFGEREELRDLSDRYDALTPREREVFRLVVAGRLNKQIARELRISEKTVKVHRGRVMRKMGTRRVAELVYFAVRLGLSVPPPAPITEAPRRSGVRM